MLPILLASRFAKAENDPSSTCQREEEESFTREHQCLGEIRKAATSRNNLNANIMEWNERAERNEELIRKREIKVNNNQFGQSQGCRMELVTSLQDLFMLDRSYLGRMS